MKLCNLDKNICSDQYGHEHLIGCKSITPCDHNKKFWTGDFILISLDKIGDITLIGTPRGILWCRGNVPNDGTPQHYLAKEISDLPEECREIAGKIVKTCKLYVKIR